MASLELRRRGREKLSQVRKVLFQVAAGGWVGESSGVSSGADAKILIYFIRLPTRRTERSPGDGYSYGVPPLLDSKGNLFGTTTWGGAANCVQETGCGTVYRINKRGNYSVL